MHTQVFLSAQRIHSDLRDQGFLPPLPAPGPVKSAPAASPPSAVAGANSERAPPSPASLNDRAEPAFSMSPPVNTSAADIKPVDPLAPLLMVRQRLAESNADWLLVSRSMKPSITAICAQWPAKTRHVMHVAALCRQMQQAKLMAMLRDSSAL